MTTLSPGPARTATAHYVPGTPRWARVAAHAVPLVVLPSSLWRLSLAADVAGVRGSDPGQTSTLANWLYILCLSAIGEGVALLTLGLVKPWGEVVPRWIPVLGGRRVPVKAAVIPATAGAALLAAIGVYFFANMLFFHLHFAPAVGPKGGAHPRLEIGGRPKVFFLACYLPLPLWPILVAACTVAYRRRRRASGR